MIQTVITHHCTKCGSVNIVKNGKDAILRTKRAT